MKISYKCVENEPTSQNKLEGEFNYVKRCSINYFNNKNV